MGCKRGATKRLEGPAKRVIVEREMDMGDELQDLILENDEVEVKESSSFQTPPIFQPNRDSSAYGGCQRSRKKDARNVVGISILESESSSSRSTRRLSQDFLRAKVVGRDMPPPLP